MKLLWFVLLCCCPILALSQTLKGVVRDAQSGIPLSPVVVFNVRTGMSVYSDEAGQFHIVAQSGDKIGFSYIGYKTLQWTVPPGIGVIQTIIEMQPLSVQLDEFVVRIRNYTPYQLDSIERQDIYQRPLSRQKTRSVMSPFSFVGDRLSSRSKQVFRFQKDFNYWENQRFVDSRYTIDLVEVLTGLEGDSLALFMNSYPMPYDFARAATDLEIKMWIRTNYKDYLIRQSQADSTQSK